MGTLEVSTRRPRVLLGVGVLVLITALGLGWWRATSPDTLSVSDDVVNATTPVGVPVYVGVVAADSGRTLHLSGVKIRATSNTAEITIVPLLCRGGTVGVTADPDPFCTDLVDPEGETMTSGDGIVLQVTSEIPAIVVIDRVRLAFRDGLHWGTLPAGSESVVQVIGR